MDESTKVEGPPGVGTGCAVSPLTPELIIRNALHEERQRIAGWLDSLPICPAHKKYIVNCIGTGTYMQKWIEAQNEEK